MAATLIPISITYDARYNVSNVVLLDRLPVAYSHKVGWSARRNLMFAREDDPTLSITLTFFGRYPQPVKRDGVMVAGEYEIGHILFQQHAALRVWRTYVCLWHDGRQLLRENPLYPQGVIFMDHENLSEVLTASSLPKGVIYDVHSSRRY